jgi:hypothetical protein
VALRLKLGDAGRALSAELGKVTDPAMLRRIAA